MAINLGTLAINLIANTDRFSRMLTQAQGLTVRAVRDLDKLVGASDYASDSLIQLGKNVSTVGSILSGVGRSMSNILTAPIVAFGTVSVQAFGDLDHALARSVAIMGGATSAMRAEMKRTAIELSKTTTTTAPELAEALGNLAAAGLDAKAAIASLPVVNNFAKAANIDLKNATELLVTAQHSMSMESKDAIQNMESLARVADVLAMASNKSSGKQDDFAKAINKAGPAARQVGMSIEELTGVLMVYHQQGIMGEAAGEKFIIEMRDFQREAIKHADAWKRIDMAVFDANGKVKSNIELIRMWERRSAGFSDKSKRELAMQLGIQDRSFSAIQALIGKSGAMEENTKMLQGAKGASARGKGLSEEDIWSRLDKLKNKLFAVAEQIGAIIVPALEKMMSIVETGIDFWNSLSDSTKKFIVVAAGILALVGPGLLIVGTLVATIGAAMTFCTAAALGMAATIAGMTVAVGLLAVAALLVTDAFLQFFDKGNLGALDFINNFRVGGFKISTWMQAAALESQHAWDESLNAMSHGWEELALTANESANSIQAYWTDLLTDLKDIWLQIKAKNPFLSAAGKSFLEGERARNAASAQAKIDTLAAERVAMTEESTARLVKIDNDYNEKVKANANVSALFEEDAIEKTNMAEFNKIQEMQDWIYNLHELEKELPEITQPVFPDAAPLPPVPGKKKKLKENGPGIETMSLKRFSINSPSAAGASNVNQEVSDRGVQKRLDMLIRIGENKPVVLGE